MSVYNGETTIHAGESRVIYSTPSPAIGGELPDIGEWLLEARFTPTDGSEGFTLDNTAFEVATPNWAMEIPKAQVEDRAGQRLRWQTWRIDAGFEWCLEWGFLNVIP